MMMNLARSVVLILVLSVIAACTPNTSQTVNDPVAAQQLMPNIVGYTANEVTDVVAALSTAASAASLAGGNLPVAGALNRAETLLRCLQERGAVSGRSYLQQNITNIVPEAGVVVIINNDRVAENFLACLAAAPRPMTAQTVTIEPCAEAGSFTFQNNNFSFVYVGVGNELCGYFSTHFNNLRGNRR
jgi:hypothetical protein